MTRILISGIDHHAEQLAERLRRHHHTITQCSNVRGVLQQLRRVDEHFDLIVMDVEELGPELQLLDQINVVRLKHAQYPAVVCVSRSYKGPQIQLKAERKGARLVYVRQTCGCCRNC